MGGVGGNRKRGGGGEEEEEEERKRGEGRKGRERDEQMLVYTRHNMFLLFTKILPSLFLPPCRSLMFSCDLFTSPLENPLTRNKTHKL